MHYLISLAPGTVNYAGKTRRMQANETIAVEDVHASSVLQSHSFLAFSCSDRPLVRKEVSLINGPTFSAGPEAIADDVNNAPLDLPVSATVAEVITYLKYLEVLDPQPLFKIEAVGKAYPKNKQIQLEVNRILKIDPVKKESKDRKELKVVAKKSTQENP